MQNAEQANTEKPPYFTDIDEVEKHIHEFYTTNKDGKGGGYAKRLIQTFAQCEAEKYLREHSSNDQDKWILVTKELPSTEENDVGEMSDTCIIAIKHINHIHSSCGYLLNGKWHWKENGKPISDQFTVIAWQPLPEFKHNIGHE